MNMNPNRVIGTAVLVLFLGITIPAFAQQDREKKSAGGEKAQQAQPQHTQQAQPQRAQQAQPQRAQQAQPQHTQQAQPQRAQQAQPQRTQQAQPQRTQQAQPQRIQQAQPSVAQNRGNGHYGRISDDHYRTNFGHGHSFRMIRPQMISGYQRFQYGGYWFGFNQGWPLGWSYDDDVYVEYVDGFYYLYNVRHPGIHITLNLF